MRTFIQIIDGRVHWKFEAEANPYEGNPLVEIRDVTNVSPQPNEGWTANEDRTYAAPPTPPEQPGPQPNTIGNPYFGRAILTPGAFIGLAIGVLGMAAANRITTDKTFDAIKTWLSTPGTIVDPDDKGGQFLAITGAPIQVGKVAANSGYLTNMSAADGQPLMTVAQRDAIMAAWK